MILLYSSRVARTFGIIFAVLCAALIFVSRVLNYVLDLAHDLIDKALARYGSFTGKLALENFPEDKILFAKVQSLNETLLPVVETLAPVILVLGVLCGVVALCCLAFPKQSVAVLLALKIWRGETVDNFENSKALVSNAPKVCSAKCFKKPLLIVSTASFILLVVILIFCCSGISVEKAKQELENVSQAYMTQVKKDFSKTKRVVVSHVSENSSVFKYEISKQGKWTATLLVDVEGCPMGKQWVITPNVQGLFTKKLTFIKRFPADSLCKKITPDLRK